MVVGEDLADNGASALFGDEHVIAGTVDARLVLEDHWYDEPCGGLILAAQQRGQPAGAREDVIVHAHRKARLSELQADIARLRAVQEPRFKDQGHRLPIALSERVLELLGRASEHHNQVKGLRGMSFQVLDAVLGQRKPVPTRHDDGNSFIRPAHGTPTGINTSLEYRQRTASHNQNPQK